MRQDSGVATFRFYEELNDFLPPARRKKSFEHRFSGPVAIKDVIESLGVPHTEIEIVLVNGESVRFSYLLRDGDRVAVYPMFEALDVTPLVRLRPKPLRVSRFVLDAHLGTLARHLRLLGFDTLYRNDFDDEELAQISRDERRILLTRDIGLLKRSAVTHGYFLRETDPKRQLAEVVARFDLSRQAKPFARCIRCNGLLRAIAASRLIGKIDDDLLHRHRRFRQCRECGRIYWPGTHYERMQQIIEDAGIHVSEYAPHG